jgi:hypothetical protein
MPYVEVSPGVKVLPPSRWSSRVRVVASVAIGASSGPPAIGGPARRTTPVSGARSSEVTQSLVRMCTPVAPKTSYGALMRCSAR